MKTFLWIALLVGVGYGGIKFHEFYQSISEKSTKEEPARVTNPAPASHSHPGGGPPAKTATTPNNPQSLPGLPASLEPSLAAAYQRGAPGLKAFIASYGTNVQDPRLAKIELDYVSLVAGRDLAEARRVFQRVKSRTVLGSPLYDQVKDLEKTFAN